MSDGASHAAGRRPKASRGGNRAGGTCGGSAGRYGDLRAAGDVRACDPADRARCATRKRPVHEGWIAPQMMICRTI
jgi:hypothetical protein